MLNISTNSVLSRFDLNQTESYRSNQLPRANRMLRWWLIGFLIITLVVLFLPWTQNIQTKGTVTTLRPEQRPQTLNSAIAGRIEQWYVREGELVLAGDTLLFLSEVKSEYFDPNLVDRTDQQVAAKRAGVGSYEGKVNALEQQIAALQAEREAKRAQLRNKIEQNRLKLESQRAEVQQAEADLQVADFQYRRTDTLYQKGIKSLSDLETKRLKLQQTTAKRIGANNKLNELANEIDISQIQLQNIDNEYGTKIAKARSDQFATQGQLFDAQATVTKLESQRAQYQRRAELYYVTAPQTGYVTKTLKSGIGEIIKEGEEILTIVPSERELAVEMYIRPMDLPLVDTGLHVQLIFDGWQSFIVSGWQGISFGTYEAKIVAIDNVANEKSLYRILAAPVENGKEEWPELLRVGAGARGILLLDDVPVWYEIWRQLNGFPAEFYQEDLQNKERKFTKPPVKTVAK